MADLAAWADIRNVLVSGDNINQFTAGADIKAGQVVAYNATGVAWTVQPVATGTTGTIVGVALYDADSGEQVSVAMRGCIVYVQNGAQGAVDQGDPLVEYGTTTTGTVIVADISGGATNTPTPLVGFALEDHAAADGSILCDLDPGYIVVITA